MKLPLLSLALGAVVALAAPACGGPSSTTRPAPIEPAPPVAVAPAPAPVPVKPKTAFGTWGFDLGGMDRSAAPGVDFFRYANGHWADTTQIPSDKSSYGLFHKLEEDSQAQTRALVESASGAPGSEEQKIADYYKTFMDEAAIEQAGIKPLQPWLDKIAKIQDTRGVVLQLADNSRHGINTPFDVGVGQDDRQPDHYIGRLGQGGLGLPDRDMYDAKNAQFEPLRAGYKHYIEQMFTLAGLKNPGPRAAAVYALEDKLAKTHWTQIEDRDAQKSYNKLSIAELQKQAWSIDWKPWLKAVGFEGQPNIIVHEPSAIIGMAKLVKSQPVAVWRDYLTLQSLTAAAPYLSKAFVDTQFELYGKTLGGTPELEVRWKRGVDNVSGVLGEAIGKLYVAKHFTPETKAAADQLVQNLLTAMGKRLDGLTWMSPATKAKAKEKLATYNPKIGYPKQWRDYATLEVTAGDAVGNVRHAIDFEYNRQLKKLGQPVDRDEWGMTPMTVNAYYNPALNEVVFPAAILQPPFFDPNADDAVNYGSIGAVIGHEISHGFDDQGAQYDSTGTLKDWWTPEDTAKFKTATAKLVAQYDGYCPIPAADGKPAQCVKGALTLGENIADLAGVVIAYDAYKISLGGKPAPVIDGFTGDQRFFLGYAQVWRTKLRDQALETRLVTDPHSPGFLRPLTVRNLDAWYDAFQPKPGDKLFLPPGQRVRIW